MTRLRLLVLAMALVAPGAAQAAVIDFEAQGANAPDSIQPNQVRSQAVTIEGATFSGGAIVKTTDDFVDPSQGDLTAAYTTAPYSSFSNTLTIAFGSAVTNVSFQIVNNIAATYMVSVNGGPSQSLTLGDYANQTVSLANAAVSRVTLTAPISPQTNDPYYQFAIDNVSFSTMVAAVPEPSTWLTMIGGLLLIGAMLRRRHARTVEQLA